MHEQRVERITVKEQILECDVEALKATNSYWTAREIVQQPRVWQEAYAAIETQRVKIDSWLNPLLAKTDLRIVLSGAGTSSFVGETMAPWLSETLGRRFDAVSTTDIVGDPGKSFAKDVPTLMISCARSGNSPESVASITLADQVLTECHHLVLTCNPEGYLARANGKNRNSLCLLMPNDAHDNGFAMTSSFTSMLVSCAAIFVPNKKQLEAAAKITAVLIDQQAAATRKLAQEKRGRLVVLGAGCLFGIAHEATLKCLELSAGHVVPLFDTPLGFRHGPKSVVNDDTLIIHLQSAHSYSALYDADLLQELLRDYDSTQIMPLSPSTLGFAEGVLDEFWVSLPYLVYCQMFAFYTALAHDITADNPCPTGEVNRVVEGVELYDYVVEKNGVITNKVGGR